MSIDEVMERTIEYGLMMRTATISESRALNTSIRAAVEQHVAEAVKAEREASLKTPVDDAIRPAIKIDGIDRSAVGKVARKIGGSYQADGRIVAEFKADDGSTRYVFRFDVPAGMLHIFNATQVEIRARAEHEEAK